MEGYAKIADRMATLPSLAIFRSFRALRAQDLLYRQAELMELEVRFRDEADNNAQRGGPDEKLFSRHWQTLSSFKTEGQHCEQWRLVLEIREKLEKYDAALLRFGQISDNLSRPHGRDVDILAANLDDPNLSDYLLGSDRLVWKDEKLRQDLVSAHSIPDFDLTSQWLIKTFLRPYHQLVGRRKNIRRNDSPNADADLYHYEDKRLEIPATIISTALASLLPTLSIAILYIVQSMPARLGLVAAFTMIFSVGVTVLSKARRVDVFAATAAFAAVLVVFIGTNVTNSYINNEKA